MKLKSEQGGKGQDETQVRRQEKPAERKPNEGKGEAGQTEVKIWRDRL